MEKKITAWVARDKDGRVFFYTEKPRKINEIWDGGLLRFPQIFPQVKWEDEEPTEVELTVKICK